MKIDITEVPQLNEGIIENKVIAELIEEHQKIVRKYDRLDRYYFGSRDTVNKSRLLESSLNNIVIANYPKYITDINTGYFMSNEVNYNVNREIDIQPIMDSYRSQTILEVDTSNTKKISKYGKCNEIVYVDENSIAKSKSLSPKNSFLVTDNTLEGHELFGIYYFPLDKDKTEYKVYVYTKEFILEGNSKDLSLKGYSPTIVNHYFGMVPMIEIKNNDEEMGDYETVLSLIDAYNIIVSNDVDNIEQFVDAILLLFGSELTQEQMKLLQETRGLNLPENGNAQYLTKTLDESGISTALDRLRRDIHKFSMTPDISDEEFAGNSSGVALNYKLLPFEIATKHKESFFKKALKKRFQIYNNFLNIKENMPLIDVSELEIKFTRALPKNDLETAQMINYLSGEVTNKTLISNLSFIEDANEEDELVKEEKKNNILTQQSIFSGAGGFEDNHDDSSLE